MCCITLTRWRIFWCGTRFDLFVIFFLCVETEAQCHSPLYWPVRDFCMGDGNSWTKIRVNKAPRDELKVWLAGKLCTTSHVWASHLPCSYLSLPPHRRLRKWTRLGSINRVPTKCAVHSYTYHIIRSLNVDCINIQGHLACKHRPPNVKPRSYARKHHN
jgi:hypothetical protein